MAPLNSARVGACVFAALFVGACSPRNPVSVPTEPRVQAAKAIADKVAAPGSEKHIKAFVAAYNGAGPPRPPSDEEIAAVRLPSTLKDPALRGALASAFAVSPFIWQPDRKVKDGEYDETIQLIGYKVNANGQSTPIGRCTGTVIGKRAVLTAAHCLCDLGSTVGITSGVLPQNGHAFVVQTQYSYKRLDCAAYLSANSQVQSQMLEAMGGDVAVMTVKEDMTAFGIKASTLGTAFKPDASYYIVGYGVNNADPSYPKWLGSIVATNCTDSISSTKGCNPPTEFYGAGAQLTAGGRTDTCGGDSGAPVFSPEVASTQPQRLVAVTSRAVADAPAGQGCGYGGVYVRVAGDLLQWAQKF